MDWKLPLLLDGDVSGMLSGLSQEECPQQHMLENQAQAIELLRGHREAGADLLRAPTGGLNTLELSPYSLMGEARRLNLEIVDMTRKAAGDECRVAGVIRSTGYRPEPFGPLPYTDLIDTYAEQALELSAAGVELLVLEGMRTVGDARAAVLGARQAGLPLLMVMDACDEGGKAREMDPLAALLCLQELGLSGFGLIHREGEDTAGVLERLAPYALIPLLVQLEGGRQTAEELAKEGFELLAAGARMLAGGAGVTPEHIRGLRRLLDDFDFGAFPLPEGLDDTPLLLTGEGRVYYLEEDFTTSSEIACAMDMSEAILTAEDEGTDALLFRVESVEDAFLLGNNIHMAGTAVSILAGTEEALEMALLYYPGRALVDTRSDISPRVLEELVKGYGAIAR